MLIRVRVKTGAKENKVIKKGGDSFDIWVKEKPFRNQANKSIIKVLADFLKISRNRMRIIKGSHTRNKIIEIPH